jgi:hypothetical protein
VWREWAGTILKTLGREGDTRQLHEFGAPEWTQHAPIIVELTQRVVRNEAL